MAEHIQPRRTTWLTAGILALFGSAAVRAQEPPALGAPCTIVLVRHGEKKPSHDGDPPLKNAGRERAVELARHLRHSGVTHLFATEFKRTRDTLAPLAKASGVEVRSIPAQDPAALLAELSRLPPGSVAVVAGHSNTVPGLVKALAGGGEPKIADEGHDRMFIVTRWEGGPAGVVELRY